MKLATALIEPAVPMNRQPVALAVERSQPQRVGARHRVRQRISNSCPPVRLRCSSSMMLMRCCKTRFLPLEFVHLRLQLLQAGLLAHLLLNVRCTSVISSFMECQW